MKSITISNDFYYLALKNPCFRGSFREGCYLAVVWPLRWSLFSYSLAYIDYCSLNKSKYINLCLSSLSLSERNIKSFFWYMLICLSSLYASRINNRQAGLCSINVQYLIKSRIWWDIPFPCNALSIQSLVIFTEGYCLILFWFGRFIFLWSLLQTLFS